MSENKKKTLRLSVDLRRFSWQMQESRLTKRDLFLLEIMTYCRKLRDIIVSSSYTL